MKSALNLRLHLVLWLSLTILAFVPGTVLGRSPEAVSRLLTAGGLHTVHMETGDLSVQVHFPEDLVSGEPISGSLVVAPKGETERQRIKALRRSEETTLEIGGVALPLESSSWFGIVCEELRCSSHSELTPLTVLVQLRHRKGSILTEVRVPLVASPEDPSNAYRYRPVAITGRPLEIQGSFDGDSGTTRVTLGNQTADILAESPRRSLAEIPAEAVGPGLLELREDGRSHSGPFRGLRVALEPGKPALHPGERTMLTLQILGLDQLDGEMPVQIVSQHPERVLLEAGSVQTLHIHPTELQAGGVYRWIGTIQGSGGGPVDVTVSTHHSRPEQRLIPRSPSEP